MPVTSSCISNSYGVCTPPPEKQHKIDPSRPHNCLKCYSPHDDFMHLAWSCQTIQNYWINVHDTLGAIIGMPLTPIPEVALLGYVANYPKTIRKLVAVSFLLAKREIALNWGNKRIPLVKHWMSSLVYCNTNSEIYADLLPQPSRPRDIWGPLRIYLSKKNNPPELQNTQGLVPTGIG